MIHVDIRATLNKGVAHHLLFGLRLGSKRSHRRVFTLLAVERSSRLARARRSASWTATFLGVLAKMTVPATTAAATWGTCTWGTWATWGSRRRLGTASAAPEPVLMANAPASSCGLANINCAHGDSRRLGVICRHIGMSGASFVSTDCILGADTLRSICTSPPLCVVGLFRSPCDAHFPVQCSS